MIERSKYLNKLVKSIDNGLPKVITGLRRCGKSFLLTDLYTKYLLEISVPSSNIIYINLDDINNYKYCDPLYLNDYINELVKERKGKVYIFIDEIQNVYKIINPNLTNGQHIKAKKDDASISFINVILGLSSNKNIDLYVTGSNSKMLSSDIITEFRDKATNIHLSPLSFKEYYSFKKGDTSKALYDYLQFGGLPLTVLKETQSEKKEYLISLFKKTYFKDIIEHNKIHNSDNLDEISKLLSDNVGSLINTEKIANTFLSIKKEKIDRTTINKYINYFIDAFILEEASRYDIKGKKEIGALRKYYYTDLGLRNARINFSKLDEGHLIENLVFNELIYNDYTVNIGTYNNVEKNKDNKSIKKTYEIDFYAKKENKEYYIQISDDLNENTLLREEKPFISLKDSIKKVLVVNKPIKEIKTDKGYTLIGLEEFLLKFI